MVEAACPRGYQVEKLPFVSASYRYNALASIAALRETIVTSRPTLVVPCDDYVTRQLHDIYRTARSSEPDGAWLKTLIARSLGDRIFFILYIPATVSARWLGSSIFLLHARYPLRAGPYAASLDSVGLPAVLKSDGSWSGKGVAIVTNRREAKRALRKLSTPPSVLLTLKRFTLNRDRILVIRCLRRAPSAVSGQRFVPGRLANAAVACWQGRVLASVHVEVLASIGATGPATVVRVISHPGMSRAVELMVQRLKLSGLCGFDFILSAEDGSSQLIELNPRATQTGHLIAADGKDLLAELLGAIHNSPVAPRGAPVRNPLALFPYQPGQSEPFQGEMAIQDIPWNSPELIRFGAGG